MSSTWDITTFGFEKQTSAILEFYFRLKLLTHSLITNLHAFCTRLPNFVQIGVCTAELWRHIYFQDGGHQPCCIRFGVMVDHPRSAFYHRVVTSFYFFPTKRYGNRREPPDGDVDEEGYEKNRDFRPISRFISETIRDTVSYYRKRIGNRTQVFQWYHSTVFKVTVLFSAK